METTSYQLRHLALLPDHILLMIYRPYRDACELFEEAVQLDTQEIEDQLKALRQARRRIEEELHARGIGAEPWWSEERQASYKARASRPSEMMELVL